MLRFVSLFCLILASLMLGRLVLMLSGQLKGPVLGSFELYGEHEGFFYPLPGLFFWSGVFILFAGYVATDWFRLRFDTEYLAAFFILCAWLSHTFREAVGERMHYLPVLPRWCHHLYDHTTRHERRRIAYMWLKLPLRTRLLYNASDSAFNKWVDLVILATI